MSPDCKRRRRGRSEEATERASSACLPGSWLPQLGPADEREKSRAEQRWQGESKRPSLYRHTQGGDGAQCSIASTLCGKTQLLECRIVVGFLIPFFPLLYPSLSRERKKEASSRLERLFSLHSRRYKNSSLYVCIDHQAYISTTNTHTYTYTQTHAHERMPHQTFRWVNERMTIEYTNANKSA